MTESSPGARLTDIVDAIEHSRFDVIVVNYANGDMVGHTGILAAAGGRVVRPPRTTVNPTHRRRRPAHRLGSRLPDLAQVPERRSAPADRLPPRDRAR